MKTKEYKAVLSNTMHTTVLFDGTNVKVVDKGDVILCCDKGSFFGMLLSAIYESQLYNDHNNKKRDVELWVNEYIADPNCAPHLWISYETPIESERRAFCNDGRVIDAYNIELIKRLT